MKYLLLCAVLLSACSSSSNDDASIGEDDAAAADALIGPDGEVIDAGPSESVEVGTGSDGFEPIATGEVVPFIQGPQGGGRYGGYHLWGAARVRGFELRDLRVAFTYYKASDRTEIASQERILTPQPSGNAHATWGFAPQIQDCCLVLDTDVVMYVEVEDTNGKTASDERTIRTLATCVDVFSMQSVCP